VASDPTGPIEVPEDLAASHARFSGDRGRAWIAALPRLAADRMDRWALRSDGPPVCGAVALVLPVLLPDGTPAVLKLQPVDEETVGEPVALHAWKGDRAVDLLRHDPESGSMLLERLDAGRTLAGVPDDLDALATLSEILVHLNALAAPPEIRRLSDVAAAMLDAVPHALTSLSDPDARRLIQRCAAAVEEVLPEPGDRLLHWDLHYDNVLARPLGADDGRPSWAAIDPKPLAGDPGFELLAALHNRWEDAVTRGDVRRAVLRRYDLMTDVLGLDRQRAARWTLGRVLQNLLWESEYDATAWHTDPDRAIADALIGRY
jgi:streptomycin 6-kinase